MPGLFQLVQLGGGVYACKNNVLDGLELLVETCPVGELAQYDAERLERIAHTVRIRLAEESEKNAARN
jgi:hypothetical protein